MTSVRVYIVSKFKKDRARRVPIKGFLTRESAFRFSKKSKGRKIERVIEVVW